MHISKRADGRFMAQVQVNGVRHSIYGRSENDVRERARALAQSRTQTRSKPRAIDPSGGTTLGDLFHQWLATATLKPRTRSNYRQIWRLYIEPAFGSRRLIDVSTIDLEAHIKSLHRHGIRAPSHAFACLRRMLRLAVRWGWLRSSPLEHVEPPSYRPKEVSPWTAAQLRDFLEDTKIDALHPLWVLVATTGIRMGEALALRWCDVDLNSRVLRIEQTIYRERGDWIISEPKTRAGKRTIPLGAICVEALRGLRSRSANVTFVFSTIGGRPYHAPNVVKAFQKTRKRLGLPSLTPHGLRHTHASLLIEQNVPISQISRRLGHANTHITTMVYGHAIGGGEWLADLTDSLLRPPPPTSGGESPAPSNDPGS